jgi:hypothetical protein
MTFLVALVLFAFLAIAASKFGADTRESGEWEWRDVKSPNRLRW